MDSDNHDPLSDMLRLLDVRVAPPCRLEAAGDWALRFAERRYVRVGVALRGHLWLTVGTAAPVLLRAGDCWVLASGTPFQVSSDPNLPAEGSNTAKSDVIRRHVEDGDATTSDVIRRHLEPGGRSTTSAISAVLTFDETAAAMLVGRMPDVSAIRAGTSEAAALRPVLGQLAREMSVDVPGSGAMRDHLTHILFVQTLRLVLSRPDISTGSLRALGDERLHPALTLIHGRPGEPWTVAKLAAAAGMSRSAFAHRFKTTVGLAPLDYLSRWRVQSAARLLRATDRTVSSLAGEFGFSTASSFIRTFKRVTGQSPARYRLEQG
jgi:AraC-like DNA-binding protein